MDLLNSIDKERIPRHIAIIMDGNGVGQKSVAKTAFTAHHEGVVSVREIVNTCGELGVEYLTLYAFSTENWNRPKEEVDALMELLVNTIGKEVEELKKNNVRLRIIGDFKSLPEICQTELNEAIDITADNTGLNTILALSYSSKWEILEATKQIADKIKRGEIEEADITDELFHAHLSTAKYHDPELMIRTSGEHRISNYLLYQLAYAELYFTDVHWPDFRKQSLYEAILDYNVVNVVSEKQVNKFKRIQHRVHKTILRNLILITICIIYAATTSIAQINTSNTEDNGLGQIARKRKIGTTDVQSGPKEYTIAGVTVSGTKFLDNELLITVSGLTVGEKIRVPSGDKVSKAIRNLWKQNLFSDISITATRILGDKIFLNIHVEERPRLSKHNYKGIEKSEAQELADKVGLVKSRVVTDATKKEAIVKIKKYYYEKGFNDVKVEVEEYTDSISVNAVRLTFVIDKGSRTRINQVNIAGNTVVSDARLKRILKGTKEKPRISLHPADDVTAYGKDDRSFAEYMKNFNFLYPSKTLEALNPYLRLNLFSSSKFSEKKLETDEDALIAYYNSLGFRDAIVEDDTVYKVADGNLNIDIKVREGHKYYFGDIEWKGNTKYSSEFLSKILGIKKGDVYNLELLETRLGKILSHDGGDDVSSLYMNDGYLFFNVDPIEVSIVGDTINYEMRITEGPQATIKNVIITGNDRTNEHVVRRELRTLPGNKFSRVDLIRSQREIANLGFFDQEKIGIQPKPSQEDGTVDIEYSLVEKSSDQLQLSAGFGGGVSFYGNIGVTFNNFSLRNVLKPKFWDPLPVGDGQKFSVNYQSNGRFYNSMNVSFTEPWLGGKKPNSLTTNFLYSKFNNSVNSNDPNSSFMRVLGGGLSLSRRIKWPDDNFIFTYGVNYQNFKLKQYELIQNSGFNNGESNNLYIKLVLARYSIDQPLYPTSGSNINFTFQFTPPFSAFDGKDYSVATPSEKYKWIEYHKYRFTAEWYQKILGKMVFKFATKYGFMGYYNPDIGFAPFERFQVGGDGLSGQNFFVGRDIIAHRGYGAPYSYDATIFNKYTAEVRFPFSLSPTSTIYGLCFVEAANAWSNFSQYNPSNLNRSAGVGIRVILPMFGLLGLDYGVGFDRYDKAAGLTKMKDIANFTFMLGFEPD